MKLITGDSFTPNDKINHKRTLLSYILTIPLLNLIITNEGGGIEGCICFVMHPFYSPSATISLS